MAPNNAPTMLLPDDSAYLPAGKQANAKDFFGYGAQFLPLGAGATTSFQINIQADSSFLLKRITGVARTPDNLTVLPTVPVLLQFQDTASGRQSLSIPQDWNALVGDGTENRDLPYPKYIQPTSTFSVIAQNLDPVNPFNLRLSLLGFKVF